MSVTISGMVPVNLSSSSGWSTEQILSALSTAISQYGGAEPISVSITVTGLTTSGTVRLQNLPTSASGLAAGTVWNSSGTLRIA